MKLDKIKFARLIGLFERVHALNLKQIDIELIDEIIDIEIPAQQEAKAKPADVVELLRAMKAFDGYVPAIKAYRVLTGEGLKEAKTAIDNFRSTKLNEISFGMLRKYRNEFPVSVRNDNDELDVVDRFISFIERKA